MMSFIGLELVLDLAPIQNFFALPAEIALKKLLFNVGWIPIAIVFLWGSRQLFLFWRNILYSKTLRSVFLAIDIPKGNEQSVKAVENLFTYLGGAHDPPDLIEKWWGGRYQLGFSFEVVSIDGYTQFLVWTPVQFRDMVETAVYSQYPDAEITEVNDYTQGIPTIYPDDEYDFWGAEMLPAKSDVYPIKTYPEFESPLAGKPETQFKDPMALLMDLNSSLGPGEQLWYQVIIYPTGFDWVEKGEKEISKILNETSSKSNDIVDMIINGLLGTLTLVHDAIFGGSEETKKEEKDDSLKMMNLKPKEKKQVESIQKKSSQQGFETKIRFIYVAKKDVINKAKARNGFIGFMKQFMDLDLNNLKPDMDMTATTAHYFFVDYRKNEKKRRLMSGFKGRSGTLGRKRFIMNVEELATIWHFPLEAVVKAPLIQKAPGRKAEPPISLPIGEERIGEEITGAPGHEDIFTEEKIIEKKDNNLLVDKEIKKGSPPQNLPVG